MSAAEHPFFDHSFEMTRDPKYAEEFNQKCLMVMRTQALMALVIKVNPQIGEGLVFGNRLNEDGVKERVVKIVGSINDAINRKSIIDFYCGRVDFLGLTLGGNSYTEIDPKVPIDLPPKSLEFLGEMQTMLKNFQKQNTPQSPSEKIICQDMLSTNIRQITPSEAELLLAGDTVLITLALVHLQRLKSQADPKEKRILGTAQRVLTEVAKLKDPKSRKKIAERIEELNVWNLSTSEKLFDLIEQLPLPCQ